jgi:hypothetical protein
MGCFSGVESTWASQLDVGRTHIATKGTVQSGLVLNLDAGASSSYSGIGTTWNDLSVGTGALPIYNTTNSYGTVKSTGTRTDANASSLVLAIPMDGVNNGTTFTDESANIRGSGSAKSITVNGNTKTLTAVSKFYGSSGFFDGSGDYLNLGTSSDYLFGTGDFTIEGWFYLTSDSTRQDLMGNYSGSTTGWGLQTSYGVAGQIGFFYGNNIILDSAARVWSPNSWTHFAITRSGTSLKLFVNGVNTTTTTNSTDISTTSNPLFIGAVTTAYIATPQLFCTGYLQDFRIYKGLAKYTSNFIPSGNPNNGTLVGSPTYSSANGSLSFDGSSQYATVPLSSNFEFGTGQFAVEAWVNLASIPATSGRIIGIGDGANGGAPVTYTGWTFNVTTESGATYLRFYRFDGTEYRYQVVLSSYTNQWFHFVATRNASNTLTLYSNGVAVSTTTSVTQSFNSVNSQPLYLATMFDGASGGSFKYINGRIAVARIYKGKSLSTAEVAQNYNALRGRYIPSGTLTDPFSSPVQAQSLGISAGSYYFKSGSMSSAQLLEYQPNYYESKPFCCVFRSPYASTATTNKLDLSIPMSGLLVQRDALDLRGAVYWSTPITYTTTGTSGIDSADSGTGYASSNARRVILGYDGGHGLYNTSQSRCYWSNNSGSIGSGYVTNCGSFPNGLQWGTGGGGIFYSNASGIWSHWITWG